MIQFQSQLEAVERATPRDRIEMGKTIRLRRHSVYCTDETSQRLTLADDDPSSGTPGGGKEEDVDTDESDLGLNSAFGGSGDTDDTDDELANQHAEGTPDEQRTTTESFDSPERDGGGANIDESGDKTDQEWVGNCAESLEEGGTEVEDEVDTGPLLHHLGISMLALIHMDMGRLKHCSPAWKYQG